MESPRAITFLFIILFIGVSGVLSYLHYRTELFHHARLASLLGGVEKVPALEERTKEDGCSIAGALPDAACSPGAVFPNATPKQFCVAGYTKTVRNVSAKLKAAVYAEYGIQHSPYVGAYEVDHLIPLAIGGSNDIANLWPQAADPRPGFHEKDIVEVYLQEEVCAGHVAMGVAQERIAHDWLSIYDNLSPEDITRITARYGSGAN